MATLTGQSIASSYEQLLHVDTDGGGNTTTLVPIKDGDNGTTFAAQLSTTTICIDNPTTSSSSQGGILRLQSDDGAALGDTHRLGVIEFGAAEDGSNTITTGARIEAIADAAWSASENGADMVFYTTDGNASQSEVMRLTADNLVGIGTDAPDHKLTIVGTVAATGSTYYGLAKIHSNNGQAAGIGGALQLGGVYHDDGSATDFAYLQGEKENSDSADFAGAFTVHTRANGGSFTEQMRIDSSGNVGIGIAAPDNNLHVHKATAGSVSAAAASVMTIENSSHAFLQFLSPNNVYSGIYFGDVDANTVGELHYNHSDDSMGFITNASERMRIDS